jgi:hypothetical protein
MIFKLIISSFLRLLYKSITGKTCISIAIREHLRLIFDNYFEGISRTSLAWHENVRKLSATGIASALDIGFSNWSFEFITISLYTMTKSTCIIFILMFAILFDLEKKVLNSRPKLSNFFTQLLKPNFFYLFD